MNDRSELIRGLAVRIHSIELDHPTRVAIDGIDGAGKTSLADELVEPLTSLGRPVIRASIDQFHRNRAERHRRGQESPDGYYHDSFDYAAVLAALLGPLGPAGDCRYRTAVFDFRADKPACQRIRTAERSAILLFDGVFLLRPELIQSWDFTVYLKTSFSTALKRVVDRDASMFGSGSAARKRYETRYQPGQRLYLAEARPEESANVVIINDDPARPRVVSGRIARSAIAPVKSRNDARGVARQEQS